MTKLTPIVVLLFFITNAVSYSQSFERILMNSSDDAEEKFDGSYVTTSSSDIELTYDSWNDQGAQYVGLRFDSIFVPINASITNSYIQFTADGSYSGSVSLTIKGELSGSSLTFYDVENNISGRSTTSSFVNWDSIPPWNDEDSGLDQKSPNLSEIVSEVITSNSWEAGNPITFIITGSNGEENKRKAYSFDKNPLKSAKLFVEYSLNSSRDLAIVDVVNPEGSCYTNPLETVSVSIVNYGADTTYNYSVSYSINGQLIATEAGITPLGFGEQTLFTFTQKANLDSAGVYNVSTEVLVDDDENLLNNVLAKSITVIEEFDSLLFNQESSWVYWDSLISPGESWNTINYNDSLWKLGFGQFGFGENDEQTVLNEGLVSYYFRKKITVPDVAQLSDVYFHFVHDDAALVYINGQEVVRTELMPLGVVGHATPARQSSNSTNENNFYTYKVSADYFVSGTNTIAVSTHNASSANTDLSFACFVTADNLYDQDGPYVYYVWDSVVVTEVTPNGLESNTYASTSNLELTCKLPHMGVNFTFNLKPEITIEPSVYSETPSKFLVISDFDGHIEAFTMLLKGEGIIDESLNWIYGSGNLIITGDLFDRGYHVTECMWLLYKLELEAENQGGKIHLIIGNHEIFNLTDDWRYAEIKYFNNAHLMGKRMAELYNENTELGRWLRSKNIIEKIGDYAFMHGGLSVPVSNLNLSYNEINDYGRIIMNGEGCPNSDCETVTGNSGVYWYRGMANGGLSQDEVAGVLENFDVNRVVIGHTKDENNRSVRPLYNGSVLAIDMYHVENFEDGFMEALQFELGCFYKFRTEDNTPTYTLIDSCDVWGLHKLELNKEGGIKIYPNPSSEVLTIEIPEYQMEQYDYTITNLQGQEVGRGSSASKLLSVNVSSYPEGAYVLTLKNKTFTIKGSFILKH